MDTRTRSLWTIGGALVSGVVVSGCNVVGALIPQTSVSVEAWVVDPMGEPAISRPSAALSNGGFFGTLARGVADPTGHFILSGESHLCDDFYLTIYDGAASRPYAVVITSRSLSGCGDHSVTIQIPWTFRGLADADGLYRVRIDGVGSESLLVSCSSRIGGGNWEAVVSTDAPNSHGALACTKQADSDGTVLSLTTDLRPLFYQGYEVVPELRIDARLESPANP
jgi:hypothetical protein